MSGVGEKAGTMRMTIDEVMGKGLQRIRRPHWAIGAYVKLNRMEDGAYGLWIYLVSPVAQGLLNTAPVEIRWDEAFGMETDWEEYRGMPLYGF